MSVEVTYLGSTLSKHPTPVPVTLTKHSGLVCALWQYIWYFEEAFHIIGGQIWSLFIWLIKLFRLDRSNKTYCIATHSQVDRHLQCQCCQVWTALCPSKPNQQKVWMFQNAYKLLQKCRTWMHPRLVQTWCWWNLSILPHIQHWTPVKWGAVDSLYLLSMSC